MFSSANATPLLFSTAFSANKRSDHWGRPLPDIRSASERTDLGGAMFGCVAVAAPAVAGNETAAEDA
jgi:hypothetical protein